MNLFTCILFVLILFTGCKREGTSVDGFYANENIPPPPNGSQTSILNIAGGNWACPNDNYNEGWLLLSGMNVSDDYKSVLNLSDTVYSKFIEIGINTVRLPINPATVLESWWSVYDGTIDEALNKNMKVILCCWEGTIAKDGKIDDMTKFLNMWSTVINKYGTNPNVYFEIFNEPFGYSKTDWGNICEQWIQKFPDVSQDHILISGTGYSANVVDMATDARFSKCLFALHIYAWFGNYSNSNDWQNAIKSNIGSFSNRTVVTEYGANMSLGYNYFSYTSIDHQVAYIQGITNQLHNAEISSVYWPGLRTGDSYSMFSLSNNNINNQLKINSASGLAQVQYGWNISTGLNNPFSDSVYYKIVDKNSNAVLDIKDSSYSQGSGVIQSSVYTGSNSQQWRIIKTGNLFYEIVNRKSNLVLDVSGASLSDGGNLIQWSWGGDDNQQWFINDLGGGVFNIMNRSSGKALDIVNQSKADQSSVVQWTLDKGLSQQWQIIKL